MAVKVKGKRVRRSVGEQRAVLSRFAASGLGVAAFCRDEGINPTSLYRWQARHGKPGVGGNEVTPAERAPAFVDLGALRTISPSGQRLEVKLDLGEGLVLQLVRG
jgi:transposase-like protein